MTLTELEERLDRHGADLARWPDAAAGGAARRLVLADRDARALWEEARDLAALLGADRVALDAALAGSGRAVAERLAAEPLPLPFVRRRLLKPAAGLAAALLLGMVVGLTLPNPASQSDGTLVVALDQVAFGSYEDLQP